MKFLKLAATLPFVALLLFLHHASAESIIRSAEVDGKIAEMSINEDPITFDAYITLDPDVESMAYVRRSIVLKPAGTLSHQVQSYEIYNEDRTALIPNTTCIFETPQLYEPNSGTEVQGDIVILPLFPVGVHNFKFYMEDILSASQAETYFAVDVTFTVHPVIASPLSVVAPLGYTYDADTDTYAITVRENTTISFSFLLATQPGQDTEISLQGNTTGAVFTPSSFSWAAATPYVDWSKANEVSVAIPADGITTGDYVIELVPTITGDAYNLPKILLNVIDIDVVAYHVSKSAFVLTEGESDTLTIYTGSKPMFPINMTFPVHTLYYFEPSFIIIDDVNYNTPQTVTLHTIQNNVVLGRIDFLREFFTVTTDDVNYATAPLPIISIRINDDDIIIVSLSPNMGIDDGEYNTTITLSPDVTLDVTKINPVVAPYVDNMDKLGTGSYSAVTPLGTNIAGDDLTVIDGNLLPSDSPFYPFRNSTAVGTYNGVPNIFFRTFYCQFGEPNNFKLTRAFIKGPRTIVCEVPACVENPLDVSTKCVTPLFFYLVAATQLAKEALPFIYMWGPQHDVIDPLKYDPADEVWRSSATAVTPNILHMREETWLTIDTYHMGVITDRAIVARSIPEAIPRCRIGGFLSKESYYIDVNDHSKGMRCLAPKREDLTGDTVVIDVTLEVSSSGLVFEVPYGLKIGYYDFRKEKDSDAWTYFFIAVNIAFLFFFLFLLKDVVCARMCKRCMKGADAEKEEVIDIRGPKPVSEYLKKRIEEMLSADERALRELRYMQAIDKEEEDRLRAAGYMTEAEKKKSEAENLPTANDKNRSESDKIQSAQRARAARQPYLAHQLRKDLHKVSNGGVTPGGAVVVDDKLVGASHTHQSIKSVVEEEETHGSGAVVGGGGVKRGSGSNAMSNGAVVGLAAFIPPSTRIGSGNSLPSDNSGSLSVGGGEDGVQMSEIRARKSVGSANNGIGSGSQNMNVGGSGGNRRGSQGVEMTPMK